MPEPEQWYQKRLIEYGSGGKFDFNFKNSRWWERKFAEIFVTLAFDRGIYDLWELKTETWQWQRQYHICLEYEFRGRPSGIAATQADMWVHQLCLDDDTTLVWSMFPIERLKELGRRAYVTPGLRKVNAGDHGQAKLVLVPLRWIYRS